MANLFRANKKGSGLPFTPASTLEGNSWAQIRYLLVNDLLGLYYNVGDTKTITLTTGETLTMQLASINNGTGSAGTYYPNHTADFISVELMDTTHGINTQRTNVGGWNGCEMRTYLNETVYPTLPTDLKNIVIEKTHMRTEGNQSTSLISASDKLWLPTDWELFGDANPGRQEDAAHNEHYSIFSDNTSRIKYRKEEPTTDRYWWSSSPYVNASDTFADVSRTGVRSNDWTDLSSGVVLCFRIG